jgi:hypothetical protein
MRCTTHRKDFQGDCMWCGKKLCAYCIAKQEGRKLYCEHCAVMLVPYKREPLPATKTAPKPVAQVQQAAELPAVKRRFVLSKDGYFQLR